MRNEAINSSIQCICPAFRLDKYVIQKLAILIAEILPGN